MDIETIAKICTKPKKKYFLQPLTNTGYRKRGISSFYFCKQPKLFIRSKKKAKIHERIKISYLIMSQLYMFMFDETIFLIEYENRRKYIQKNDNLLLSILTAYEDILNIHKFLQIPQNRLNFINNQQELIPYIKRNSDTNILI